MDIRIGGPPSVGSPGDKTAQRRGASIEARVLDVRRPRRRVEGRPSEGERRGESPDRDPSNGRVLVLLIPDGSRLPPGLEADQFRVFLRFVRR